MKFRKGQSGNPGGRPKVLGELQELARQHAPTVIAELARLALKAKKESVRISAIRELLDRGYGRPRQGLEVSIPSVDPLQMLLDEIDARSRIEPPVSHTPDRNQLPLGSVPWDKRARTTEGPQSKRATPPRVGAGLYRQGLVCGFFFTDALDFLVERGVFLAHGIVCIHGIFLIRYVARPRLTVADWRLWYAAIDGLANRRRVVPAALGYRLGSAEQNQEREQAECLRLP